MIRLNQRTIGGLAVLVLIAGATSLFFLYDDGGESCQDSCLETADAEQRGSAPGTQSQTQRQTVEHTFVVPVNVAANGVQAYTESWRAFETAPKNVTGTKVQAVYEAPTQGTGLSQLAVGAGGGGENFNRTNEPTAPGLYTFRVPSAQWNWTHSQPFWVGVGPKADGSVVAGAQVHVYVTVFTNGPPDWSYSAVDP